MMPRAPTHARAATQLSETASGRIRRVRLRAWIAALMMSSALAGIGYKAWGLQIQSADHFRRMAARQHLRTVEIPAPRGEIRDRRDLPLAATADAESVYANPREVVDVVGTADRLARALDLDVRVLEARLGSSRHFAWIARHVSDAEAAAVRALRLPGVEITREPRRYYPGQSSGGTLLGFAGVDGEGLDGVELAMNDLLTGQRASFAALRDARGKTMMSQGLVEATPGATVTLTIDRSIQFIAEQALAASIAEHQARAGTVIVLDVATSKVLAMASWPTYDPNAPERRPGRGSGDGDGDGGAPEPARNRAVTDAFEIGSIMKIFTVAGALEAGAVRPDDVIDTEGGRFRIGRKTIRDVHHDGELTIGGIIKRSSNVGAAKIAQRMGRDTLFQTLRNFGFGDPTGIELPGEQRGVVRDPKTWGEIGLATVAYGYGLAVTPLQIAAGVAAVGNGGIYHEPRLIERVTVEADGESAPHTLYQHAGVADPGRRVISAKTAAQLMPMLESVFDQGKLGGTAKDIVVDGFRVAGKSGTAHKLDPHGGGYSDDLYLASFAGVAPAEAPRIAVVVVIDEPRGEDYFGAKVAGPVFAQVTGETLRYLGVPSSPPRPGDVAAADQTRGLAGKTGKLGKLAADDERDAGPPPSQAIDLTANAGSAFDLAFDAAPRPPGAIDVPSFAGMGVAQAVDEARARGLRLRVVGSGRAIEQMPPAGTAARGAVSADVDVRVVFGR